MRELGMLIIRLLADIAAVALEVVITYYIYKLLDKWHDR